MSLRLATVAACASLGLACPSAAAPLDGLFGFVDPHWCERGEDFDTLLDSLIEHEQSGPSYVPALRAPVVPAAFRTQIGEPWLVIDGSEYRATLPLEGTWRGLSLRSLVIVGWVESEQGFGLVFDATPAEVLQAANKVGFAIPPSGSEYRVDENGVMGMNVGVSVDADGSTVLSCFPG
jgi:hypothetical protein